MATTNFATVTEYLAAQPQSVRAALKIVRSTIRKALPGGEDGISYQLPIYKIDGRAIICYAGWKAHYSIYPSSRLEAAFKDELARYEKSGKGTIRFPLSEPVPVKLIAAIAKFRLKEVAERAQAKAASKKR